MKCGEDGKIFMSMANRMVKRIAAATLSDLEKKCKSDECDDFSHRKVYSKVFIIITQFF